MKPKIFICNKVVEYFDDGISTISSLLSEIKSSKNSTSTIPSYLFAYCKYEGTLYQIYKHTIKAFPERANLKKLDVSPEDILKCSCTATILDMFCISFSKKFGEGDIGKYKSQYENAVNTKITLPTTIVNSINEFKYYRNQLAHHGRIDSDKRLSSDMMYSHIEAAIQILTLYKDSFFN